MASTAPAERKGLLEDDDEEDEPRLPLTCWAVASDYLTLLNEERDFSRFLLLLCLNGVLYASFLPFLPIFVSAELQLPQSFTGTFRTCSLVLMAATPVALGVLDCLTPKQSVLLGMLGTTGAGLIFLTASGGSSGALSVLFVQGAVQGALDGMLTAAGKTYMVTVARPAKLGVATALYFIGSTLGSALGSAAGGWVLAATGSSFQLLGLLMVCGSVVLTLTAAAVLPGTSSQLQDQTATAAAAAAAAAPVRSSSSRRVAFLAIVRRRAVWSLAGCGAYALWFGALHRSQCPSCSLNRHRALRWWGCFS
jgi:MFS family permease